jgi:adenosylhomocysteine nucleosidase
MHLGILVALPEELSSLSKATINQGELLTLASGISVSLAGTGANNAERATQQLIAAGAQQIISWGCAGALAPYLKSGDLIIPETIQTLSGAKVSTNTVLRTHIIKRLGQQTYFEETLLESATIVASAQEKSILFQTTIAIAVDMESAAAAQICQQKKIPFIAIRSIADPANFDLPKAISHSIDSEGSVNLTQLIFYIICHPSELPSLVRLGYHFKAANKKLKQISPLLVQVAN